MIVIVSCVYSTGHWKALVFTNWRKTRLWIIVVYKLYYTTTQAYFQTNGARHWLGTISPKCCCI